MRALLAEQRSEPARLAERDDPAGPLVLRGAWSSVNYKDALAVTGAPGVLRALPLVPGIDVAGTDEAGDAWVVTGAGLGERVDGGYAERTAVDPTTAVRLPPRFDLRSAALIGTAGVTAALAVIALERAPDGPVLVTGAGGGVGGFAVALLAAAGREVVASSGRPETAPRLRALGASEVVGRLSAEPGRPLQTARWAGVVDSVGGAAFVNAIAALLPGGVAAACGLAGSADLPGSVLPFILRGAVLAGIDSVALPRSMREAAWTLLTERLPDAALDAMAERTVGLDGVVAAGRDVLAGRVSGRTLVDLTA